MRSGSRNCGPCLNQGVITEAKLSSSKRIRVRLNGRPIRAPTTRQAVREVAGEIGVEIDHRSDVPAGIGLGVSGAGALGAALATAGVLGLPLSEEQLIRSAHLAEVMCRTGLGDVPAQALGGLVLSLEPGPPPYGRWKQVEVPGDIRVVVCFLGGLKTSKLLSDEDIIARCRRAGKRAVQRLRFSPDLSTFLQVSKEFSHSLGLFDSELRSIARDLERAGTLGSSQVMLGRSVFAFTDSKHVGRVKKVAVDLVGNNFLIARVSKSGPRRLD